MARDKSESKLSNQNKDKKCFYCDKIGHVKADCRMKKRDDEEHKTTLAQNSLTSSSDATSPPGLTNVPASTYGASTSSLRQLTVPSHVSDGEFHSPMRIFAWNAGLHVDRVMVDWSVLHTALVHLITEMSTRQTERDARKTNRERRQKKQTERDAQKQQRETPKKQWRVTRKKMERDAKK